MCNITLACTPVCVYGPTGMHVCMHVWCMYHTITYYSKWIYACLLHAFHYLHLVLQLTWNVLSRAKTSAKGSTWSKPCLEGVGCSESKDPQKKYSIKQEVGGPGEIIQQSLWTFDKPFRTMFWWCLHLFVVCLSHVQTPFLLINMKSE